VITINSRFISPT